MILSQSLLIYPFLSCSLSSDWSPFDIIVEVVLAKAEGCDIVGRFGLFFRTTIDRCRRGLLTKCRTENGMASSNPPDWYSILV